MNMRHLNGAAFVAGALAAALPAGAAITKIVTVPQDYTCQQTLNTCNPVASTTDAIGFAGGSPSWAAILPFPLPTLPPGQIIGDQTTLTVTLASVGNATAMNGDLWGVANFRTDIPTTSTPDSSFWYYLGSNTGPGSNATPSDVKLLDNYLKPTLIGSAANTAVTTAFGATNTLQGYIQAFYDANPNYNASSGQAYVWLRINCDGPTSSTSTRYVINAGDSSVSSALRPTLNLDISDPPGPPPLVWNGNISPAWDFATANWTSNSAPGFQYQDGDSVLFDSTLTGSSNVTLDTVVMPSNVKFNSAGNYSLSGSGKISGATGLTKLGLGTLVVDTDNDYSGATTLAVGTLQVGNNDTHGLIGTGPVAVTAAGATLAFNRTDAITVNTVYNAGGAPNIVVNSGVVTLSGNNDNISTGATVNSGGTLILDKPSSAGVHALGVSSTINAGGTLQLGGSGFDQIYQNAIITDNGLFDLAGQSEGFNGLAGNGVVTNSVATATVLELGDGNGTAAYSGVIGDGVGTVEVDKAGTGVQTLSGANTFTGGSFINAGKLILTTATTGAGDYSVNDNATLGVVVAATDASFPVTSLTLGHSTLELQNVGSTVAPVISAGSLTLNSTATINILSGSFVPGQHYPLIGYTSGGGTSLVLGSLPAGVFGTLDTNANPITFTVTSVPLTWNGDASDVWDIQDAPNWKAAGLTGLEYFDGGVVTFDDSLTGSPAVNLTTTVSPLSVTVSNTVNYTISGAGKIAGSALLTKTGSGTLILDTDNTYTGGTVLSGGVIQVGNGDAHGSIGTGAFTNLVPGSILAFNRTDAITVGTVTRTTVNNSAQIVVNSGTVTLGGSADNAGTGATVNSGGKLILAKASGSAAHALSSTTLLINPGGVMALGGTGGDQIYTVSILADNGVFDLAGLNEGFDGLNGSGVVTNSAGGTSILQLGENAGSSSFSGMIAGSLAVTKLGAGTLTLGGSNSYTGRTAIGAGKVVVTTASVGDGPYSVSNSAALSVKVASPDASLNTSALTLGTTAATTLEFQNLNSVTAPAINAGSLAVNGAVTVNITGGSFVSGQDYPLLAYTSRSGSGAFTLGALPTNVTATLNSASSPITLHIVSSVDRTPTNIVTSFSNGVLTLQWPSAQTGWMLQSNSIDIGNSNDWFTVPGSTSTNSASVSVEDGGPQVFYRLRD
ncbi:MAG TPA: autotransporter-associated beta strand repeat-containing protein [Verrucomicrobiae bacterium]|jgi:autotransporter-associated beta strand protein|nr:autotransporter-associated beta strand repeat-containing protein [Verrucomicrobiae bacterium]